MLAAWAPAASALSLAFEETLPAPAAVNTSPPKLAGTPVPGQALTCSTGAWSGNPSSFSYIWLRDRVPITGQAASRYTVQGADRGHALSCSVTARNDGGEYAIQGLPSATYEVEFHAESSSNYLSQEFREKPTSEKGDPVVATAGTTTGPISASMQRGGQISGKVTAAATGIPLKGVEVCVAGAATHFKTCEYSGASGGYLVSGLPADAYQVEFQTFEPGYNYAPQFYSGKAKAAEATPVQVAAGAATAGVNAALTAGGSITGTVTATEAGPLAGAEVCVDASFAECTTTDSQGNYTITNLPTGKYTVSFTPIPEREGLGGIFGSESGELTAPKQSEFLPQYYNGKSSYLEAQEVPVEAGGTVSGINATLARGRRISGTVVEKEGGAPVAKVIVCAEAEEENAHCTLTSSNGEYLLEGVAPGSYVVNFYPLTPGRFGFSTFAPQRYKEMEYSEPGEPVTVKPNADVAGVNALLVPGAKVSGKVTAASSGAALSGAEVCAVGSKSGPFFGCALTQASGEYSISGLAGGNYSIYFVAPEDTEYLYQIYNKKQTLGASDPFAVVIGHLYTGLDAALQVGARITGKVAGADTGAPIAGVRVCANGSLGGEFVGSCARTHSAGPAASATSEALAVPAAGLTVAKTVAVNPKTAAVTFTLSTVDPGIVSWNLVFRNSDVGFADSLGLVPQPTAGTARSRCRAGLVRHKGRCVHTTVAFASGKRSVPAGAVKVTVHPTSKALKALRSGHTLHVSGSFLYTPTSGGARVKRVVSAVVRLPRRHHKR